MFRRYRPAVGSPTLLLAVAIAAMGTPREARAQNLVTNPGFETGDITGWTEFGNTGFSGVSPFYPLVGNSAYEFGSVGATSGIFQVLATAAGATYNLSFWLANEGTAPPNFFQVFWNGAPQLTLVDAPYFDYTFFSFQVLATTSLTDLRFIAQNDDFYWDLDDVSVDRVPSTVPEPATMALLATGMAGLAGARRRRRLA